MVRSVILRLGLVMLCAAGGSAQAAGEDEASAAWLARLQPYVIGAGRPGHNPDKHLVPAAAQEKDEMQRRLGLYAEAAAALAEFRQAAPGDLADDELKQAAALLQTALSQFEASCRRQAEQDLRDADAAIGRMEQLARAQGAKVAAKEPFSFLDREQLAHAQAVVDRSAGLFRPGDQHMASLNRRLMGLKRADAKWRAARIDETRLQPDVYIGDDAEALKKSAEGCVLRAQPGVQVLKTALITPDWEQESVMEWTDAESMALRHRVTRSLTAQVAGKRHADLRLYTVMVSQDLGAGGWGSVYGQVMFTDAILAANAQ